MTSAFDITAATMFSSSSGIDSQILGPADSVSQYHSTWDDNDHESNLFEDTNNLYPVDRTPEAQEPTGTVVSDFFPPDQAPRDGTGYIYIRKTESRVQKDRIASLTLNLLGVRVVIGR